MTLAKTDNTRAVSRRAQALQAIPEGHLDMDVTQEELRDLMAENYAEGEAPRFPRIGFPTGGGKHYSVQVGEKSEALEKLRAAIVHHHQARAYFGPGAATSRPPVCSSLDGQTGSLPRQGDRFGECRTCVHGRFGTAVNDKGEAGAGAACKDTRRLYILLPGESMPRLLTLPPGSLRNWQEFRDNQLMPLGLGLRGAIVEVGLEQTRNDNSIQYSRSTFRLGGRLDAESRAMVQALYEAVSRQSQAVAVTQEDYVVGEPAGSARPAGENNLPF